MGIIGIQSEYLVCKKKSLNSLEYIPCKFNKFPCIIHRNISVVGLPVIERKVLNSL
jgi:hypothetical protein